MAWPEKDSSVDAIDLPTANTGGTGVPPAREYATDGSSASRLSSWKPDPRVPEEGAPTWGYRVYRRTADNSGVDRDGGPANCGRHWPGRKRHLGGYCPIWGVGWIVTVSMKLRGENSLDSGMAVTRSGRPPGGTTIATL